MPPRAIASRLRWATSSEPGSPLTSSASIAPGSGNFGAVPKPPWTGSKSLPNSPSRLHTSSEAGAGGGTNSPARCARMTSADCTASSRRSRQASAIASTTWLKEGNPWPGSGG